MNTEHAIGCAAMLWLAAFPFLTLFLRRRELPLLWYLVPLLTGVAIGSIGYRFLHYDTANAVAAVMWGAASSALTATFGLFRRRTRGLTVALVVNLVIAVAAWYVMT
jgi:hypothetical protein